MTNKVAILPVESGSLNGFSCQTEGAAVPSLVSDFLQKKKMVGASEEEEMAVKNIAYTIYGGKQNTVNTQCVFIPDVCECHISRCRHRKHICLHYPFFILSDF